RVLEQVINLTRARWSDLPQQRGVVIQLRTELAEELPPIMGSEVELRDALTNLIFNAVDAMPDGGTLTLRTRLLSSGSRGGDDAARQEAGAQGEGTAIGHGIDGIENEIGE